MQRRMLLDVVVRHRAVAVPELLAPKHQALPVGWNTGYSKHLFGQRIANTVNTGPGGF